MFRRSIHRRQQASYDTDSGHRALNLSAVVLLLSTDHLRFVGLSPAIGRLLLARLSVLIRQTNR